jgi:HEAT repeat protein
LARLTDDERSIAARAASRAIERSPNRQVLIDIVHRLGRVRYEDAVPTLAGIWRNCALVPLRTAAGHALREIGSKDARTALIDLIEDSDWFSAYMAIRAIFDTSPSTAYDALIPYFDAERVRQPGGVTIPGRALPPISGNREDHERAHASKFVGVLDNCRRRRSCLELSRRR